MPLLKGLNYTILKAAAQKCGSAFKVPYVLHLELTPFCLINGQKKVFLNGTVEQPVLVYHFYSPFLNVLIVKALVPEASKLLHYAHSSFR